MRNYCVDNKCTGQKLTLIGIKKVVVFVTHCINKYILRLCKVVVN